LSQRITIVLRDDHVEKIRKIQAKHIAKSASAYSFSKALGDVLEKGLK
jgi:hypothetical protein